MQAQTETKTRLHVGLLCSKRGRDPDRKVILTEVKQISFTGEELIFSEMEISLVGKSKWDVKATNLSQIKFNPDFENLKFSIQVMTTGKTMRKFSYFARSLNEQEALIAELLYAQTLSDRVTLGRCFHVILPDNSRHAVARFHRSINPTISLCNPRKQNEVLLDVNIMKFSRCEMMGTTPLGYHVVTLRSRTSSYNDETLYLPSKPTAEEFILFYEKSVRHCSSYCKLDPMEASPPSQQKQQREPSPSLQSPPSDSYLEPVLPLPPRDIIRPGVYPPRLSERPTLAPLHVYTTPRSKSTDFSRLTNPYDIGEDDYVPMDDDLLQGRDDGNYVAMDDGYTPPPTSSRPRPLPQAPLPMPKVKVKPKRSKSIPRSVMRNK